MSRPNQLHKGNHALRKRCPVCKKVRRFYEPPRDQGGAEGRAELRVRWRKVKAQWVCVYCVERGKAEVDAS